MRTVIQRVKRASVSINGSIYSSIKDGLLVLVGIEDADNQDDINYLVRKTVHLRIFDDENGIMNKSILDRNGEILCVSQFTLYASTKKGNRPSYIKAAKQDISASLYNKFCEHLEFSLGKRIETGKFGADMQIELINDGPVTILIDSKSKE